MTFLDLRISNTSPVFPYTFDLSFENSMSTPPYGRLSPCSASNSLNNHLPNHLPSLTSRAPDLGCSVHQLEQVIKDEEASSFWHQLEYLGVAHRLLLLIDLDTVNLASVYDQEPLTRSAPVTITSIPPASFDG